ncbi:hypothetical protein GGR51DRAFT_509623 [Nemania sp. FL0031]|nr:hypothetical protein GGR51DRAFT_509623 [Nemania sp. FL0031]
MYRRLMTSSALLIAVLAFLLDRWAASLTPNISQLETGHNNTVLFMTNSEYGLSNVFVATAYALLDRYPEIEVHYASFEQMAARIERVSDYGVRKAPLTRRITFHELPGPSFVDNMVNFGKTLTDAVHPPGLAGATVISRDMAFYVSPWSGEDHFRIFSKAKDIINEVNPALVVLDAFLRPAIDATRNCSRLHAFISPLTPLESFPLVQPYLGWLWKYPVMGSGIPYPIPWARTPESIYLNMRYFFSMFRMSHARATSQFLKSKGLTGLISWFNIHRPNVPWLTQALPRASTPLDVIPPNVTLTGPILLALSPAEEQSPGLVKWLSIAPTILVNLGSLFVWTEGQAAIMAQALADTLIERPDLQILWKLRKAPTDGTGTEYDDSFSMPLIPFLENGRAKLETWLDAEPLALMQTGHIVASIHHGGAGCYHEALGTGVPQIVLPQWLDHYSFAQLAENTGVGVWGCRNASPHWKADCLHDAISTVVGSGEKGNSLRRKASIFGNIVKKNPGQYVAAREVAKLAGSGY